MRLDDDLRFGVRSLTTHRTRTWLTLLAMGLGTAAVIVLSALGEGARHYVLDEFTQLGTHLLVVIPGRNETTGGPPPLLGETPRDLTLDDAIALRRSRLVKRFAPIAVGSAPVSFGNLEREVSILGSTSDFIDVRHLELASGRFLPPGDPARSRPVTVLGDKLARELFGNQQALGKWVRIGDRRFRVIGLLASRGQSLGVDLGDLAMIPVASAQALFNSPALFRILIQASSRSALPAAEEAIRTLIRERHEGEDDVTIITQDAMLTTFDRILNALTLAVAGIAAVSLMVAGVLIMNVMLVAVSQRTAEVGLLKALGAARRQILALFLTEALLLAGAGTAGGLVLAFTGVRLFNSQVDAFNLVVPLWAPLAAVSVSLLTGLVFGLLPALRAARLDPVVALSGR
ncbi:MAG: ABC transporter permease [Pseudomonadota bacterium]|nr:ABC transporter permease [Pseudomonadota bacterium]